MRFIPIALAFLLPTASWAQQRRAGAHPRVDQARVDHAIAKGVGYLKFADSPSAHRDHRNSDELILLTLVHAGVSEGDPRFQDLLKLCLGAPLERTYKVAFLAMALEEIDRVKFQARIWQCAQFLVDNQCRNGQWSYGRPTVHAENPPDIPTGSRRKAVATSTVGGRILRRRVRRTTTYDPSLKPGEKKKPRVVRKVPVVQRRQGPEGGDNSNSQYAALGLRACFDAGIVFPKNVIERARRFWVASQHPVEGKPKAKPNARPAVASGYPVLYGKPRGWCYDDAYKVCRKTGPAYGTMTAGAVGALCIYNYMQNRNWRRDRAVKDGITWLAYNFSVTENVGPSEVEGGAPNAYYYYYLYALERVGLLYDTKVIGTFDWYAEGAVKILDDQNGDGSWLRSIPAKATWDTCFAILFLKRATRPLIPVATAGGR